MSAVLIVDDTPDCVYPLAKLLRLHGHTVECAGNGKEALEVMERFRPDNILLDLMMPVMDGVGFLEAMRQKPEWRGINVVVFTGYGDGLPARRLAELGVSEIFLKASIHLEHLLRVLT